MRLRSSIFPVWNAGITTRLIVITCAAYFIQALVDSMLRTQLGYGLYTYLFGLSWNGLRHGFLWQLVTYMFAHGGLYHLAVNMLALYFMGPAVENEMGTRRFLAVYFISGILGGLGWLLISATEFNPCVGASAAVLGVIAAFAALDPHREITLLLFFIIPIRMRAWFMALLMGLVEFTMLLTMRNSGVANAAHLAGGLAGWAFAYTLQHGISWPNGLITRVRAFLSRRRMQAHGPGRTPPPRQDEVDAVLDKLAQGGWGALSKRDRDVLARAGARARGE